MGFEYGPVVCVDGVDSIVFGDHVDDVVPGAIDGEVRHDERLGVNGIVQRDHFQTLYRARSKRDRVCRRVQHGVEDLLVRIPARAKVVVMVSRYRDFGNLVDRLPQ